MHDVEAIFHFPYLLTASGSLFWNMSDACETADFLKYEAVNLNISSKGKKKYEFAVSRATLIFQKRFPDAVSR